jgi:hypothetical protein
VRVRAEDGETIAVVAVQKPFGIELTYDVLDESHALVPVIEFYNEAGTELFSTHDTSPGWRRNPRPRGTYTSTVQIPGNLLAEGSLVGHVSIMSHFPATVLHAHERNAVAFQIVDSPAGDSARGDYIGPMPGVVRPLLNWTTSYSGVATGTEDPGNVGTGTAGGRGPQPGSPAGVLDSPAAGKQFTQASIESHQQRDVAFNDGGRDARGPGESGSTEMSGQVNVDPNSTK